MGRPSKGYRLWRHKNGYYHIIWSENGRNRSHATGTKSLTEAQVYLANFTLHQQQEKLEPHELLIKHVLSDYYDGHVEPNESAVVAKERVGYAINHLMEFFGNRPVAAIATKLCQEYCRYRREKRSLSDGTLLRELGVLSAALHYAIEETRLLKFAPKVWRPEKPPSKDLWLTEEQEEKLLDACRYDRIRLTNGHYGYDRVDYPTRQFTFCMIALHAAGRKAAIEKLMWTQVDFSQRRINFNPAGRKQTKKHRPIVPISDDLYEYLLPLRKNANTAYVLVNSGSIRSAYKNATVRAGLKNVTPHTLRHTWATRAAQSGVSMWDIANVLGDDEATVRKHYLHHSPDYLRSAVNFRRKQA